jgi:hypothetical protein
MADLEFTRKDIEDLTQKLATLSPVFSAQERALLLAIFAAAADRVQPRGPNRPATLPVASSSGQELASDYSATLAHFQQQLLSAYIAGNSFDSITAAFVGMGSDQEGI